MTRRSFTRVTVYIRGRAWSEFRGIGDPCRRFYAVMPWYEADDLARQYKEFFWTPTLEDLEAVLRDWEFMEDRRCG